MKPDRLAYLRQISETYVKLGDTEFTATGEDVLQLLDEREALLEALKAAADKLLWANSNLMHSWAQERPCDHEAAVEANEGETAARAAIAKAEAE